jgi:hypothetical protein
MYRDILYIVLPYFLWPLTFIVLEGYFWVMMPLSTTLLGVLTISLYKKYVKYGDMVGGFMYGAVASIFLYLIFLGGDYLSSLIGLSGYIDEVYILLEGSPDIFIVIGLVWIGVMEELYWRGGLQGLFGSLGLNRPWLISSILYMLVHVVTLNPILVVAAFIVGLILSRLVVHSGVIASSIAHVIWLILIIVIFPVR